MNLKELLLSLELTEEQQVKINTTVDTLIASKVAVKEEEYKAILGDKEAKLEEATTTLAELKGKEVNAIKERIGKEVFGDHYEKGSKYVRFNEDFDFTNEEEIKKVYEEVNNDLFTTIKPTNTLNNGVVETGATKVVPNENDEVEEVYEESK